MIAPKSNGHLMCEECGTYWCLHVEKFVKDEDDVDIIWSNYPDDVHLEVPVIPTANLWASINLIQSPKMSSTVYRVEYESTHESGEIFFIGFTHPSEGRVVLRSMLLDWFTGTQADDAMNCTSRGHGYNQVMRLKRDSKDAGKKITQQWSIWATGKCLGCTFSSGASPDLVPGADPNPANPWA